MEITEFTPSTFCWVELGTSDDKAGVDFYAQLFGWNTETHPMEDSPGDYTMLRLDGKDIGGAYPLFPEQVKMGVPPNWLSYVGVEDADAAAAKAAELGATIVSPPLDVMDYGRMAVIQDPTGATFAVWQPKKHKGCLVYGEPGALCWNELITFDTKKAGAFYSQLFGWQLNEMEMPMPYTMMMQGERPVGGIMATPPEMGEAPPHWMVYFAVGDCDEQVQKAESLGAKVCAPPMDIPTVGRMAVLADPQGAYFSIIQLAQPM